MPRDFFGARHLGSRVTLKLLPHRAATFPDDARQPTQNPGDLREDGWHLPCAEASYPMTFLTDGRPLAFLTTAAVTLYDTVTVALWALMLFLVARRSGASLTRDLF